MQNAVTSKTKYLIAGANVGSVKTAKARALGTEVIDEAALLEMLAATENHAGAEAQRPVEAEDGRGTPQMSQGMLF